MRPTDRTLRTLCYLAIYLVWGSTYLAIAEAVAGFPPLSMMGLRSVVAGGVLYAWARARGVAAPTPSQWARSAAAGAFLFAGGHGLLAWSQTRVPSGTAAVLWAMLPVWLALLPRRPEHAAAAGWPRAAGVVLGTLAVAVLVDPRRSLGGGTVDALGAAGLVAATLSWAVGSTWLLRPGLPDSALLVSGATLLAGGAALLLAGGVGGERLTAAALAPRPLLAFGYLVVFGSLLAFLAYLWLLQHEPPVAVATHAFVNPVVAVLLGAALGGETVGPRVAVGCALIVLAAALIVLRRRPTPALRPVSQEGTR